MDYFGIKEISVSVDSTDNFKAFYASGGDATIAFTSKSGDPVTGIFVPNGTILPVFSREVTASGTSMSGGKLFGLY
jgi:hypothetical protein